MVVSNDITVAELVASDYRAAGVFERFGIDFCCAGGRTLAKACTISGADLNEVERDLSKLNSTEEVKQEDYNSLSVKLLIDLIISRHHSYVRTNSSVITQYLNKMNKVHGEQNPEIPKLLLAFRKLADDLSSHMMKEEQVLFPFMVQLDEAQVSGKPIESPAYFSLERPMQMMLLEHEMAGELLQELKTLSNNYDPPEWACNTWRVCYAKLKEFEADLKLHIHLENNVLFPKSIALEKRLSR